MYLIALATATARSGDFTAASSLVAEADAVTSGAAKCAALYNAGADEVVVAPDLEFAAEVRRLTGGEGAQVAIEIVGSATFSQTLKAMAPGGRVVVVGNLESGTIELGKFQWSDPTRILRILDGHIRHRIRRTIAGML